MGPQRNDGDWRADLTSAEAPLRDDALRDLQDMLYRGLAKSLSKGGRVDNAFLEDIVQESSLKILDKLHDFEGRSKFRTWAVTIAVRVTGKRNQQCPIRSADRLRCRRNDRTDERPIGTAA